MSNIEIKNYTGDEVTKKITDLAEKLYINMVYNEAYIEFTEEEIAEKAIEFAKVFLEKIEESRIEGLI